MASSWPCTWSPSCTCPPAVTAVVASAGLVLILLLRRTASAATRLGTEMARASGEAYHAVSEHLGGIKVLVDEMIEERKKANAVEDIRERAIAYCDKVRPYLDRIRYHVDKLELLVDDELWPLPKMRELLFTR